MKKISKLFKAIKNIKNIGIRNFYHSTLYFHSYSNGDYEWEDKNGYRHLTRTGIDLLKDKNAINCWSFPNGDYSWQEQNGNLHLIRNGMDLLKDKKAIACWSFPNGDYSWKDKKRYFYQSSDPTKCINSILHETDNSTSSLSLIPLIVDDSEGIEYTIIHHENYDEHVSGTATYSY